MYKYLTAIILTLLCTMSMTGKDAIVELETTFGPVKVKLYDDTPLHRENFVKLTEEGTFDGMLFHRVIKDFMVQTGDPNSKNPDNTMPLGAGSVGDNIPAEIKFPTHYNKYGALAAARDNNPQKSSSGSQFYIVTGRKFDRESVEERLSTAMMKPVFEKLVRENEEELRALQAAGKRDELYAKMAEFQKIAEAEAPKVPEQVIEDYVTVGGAPHLDGDYTVFGEVIEGMDVVEKIQNVSTDAHDRPREDVKIISAKVLSK